LSWQTLVANPWVVGIGGSLVAAGIGWMLTRLFGTREAKKIPVTIQQNASPVLTQAFNPTITFHPTVILPTVDDPSLAGKQADSHMHKIRTESEFEKVRELWKHIVALRDAFWSIPKAGGFTGQRPGAKESAEFVKRYDAAARFLDEEILCIPRSVAHEAKALLKIAFDDALRSQHYPDPFNGSASEILGEAGWRDFVESRSNNLKNFNVGAEKLANTMRLFFEGRTDDTNVSNKGDSGQSNLVPEDGMLWRVTNDRRTGPYCPTCFEQDGKIISLIEGATQGTYSCPIHETSFWTAAFRRRFKK
jgi:hypothetical protein